MTGGAVVGGTFRAPAGGGGGAGGFGANNGGAGGFGAPGLVIVEWDA